MKVETPKKVKSPLESIYGGPTCQDRFYDFCKHILEEVISSLRREVLVALSLRRCLL